MIACPVCNGHGTVSRPPWVAGDQASWASTGTGSYTCPVCRGHGLVSMPLPPGIKVVSL